MQFLPIYDQETNNLIGKQEYLKLTEKIVNYNITSNLTRYQDEIIDMEPLGKSGDKVMLKITLAITMIDYDKNEDDINKITHYRTIMFYCHWLSIPYIFNQYMCDIEANQPLIKYWNNLAQRHNNWKMIW